MEADGKPFGWRLGVLCLDEEAHPSCLAEPSSFRPVNVGFRHVLKITFEPGYSVGRDESLEIH
jgi:hypothetical protein